MVSSPLSYLFTLHQSVAQNLSDMKHSTFENGAAQLCNVSEIAPKSPFFCVNRSSIQYDVRVGAKVLTTTENYKTNHNALCLSPQKFT